MQIILTGAYNHSIDAKNRIRIPSKLRDDILVDVPNARTEDNKFNFSLLFHYGTDNCIEIYTQEGLNRLYASFGEIKQSDTERYRALRQFMSTFEPVDCDPQGRLVIPPALKAYAGIQKDIVICGNRDHIEIWAKEKYGDYFNDGNLNINDLVKILGA